ncbi:DUF2784 domain-containing protein [Luteimonas deserti]|uniref:DUF2784 domain-containing protein n=1 Tax=Luteimonas deserti TaxID=2752306 RepID=A0A7Z0QRT6_9GAMM|nr:DUF2784 domain-containing protein [Luteimonas deserti]NYZ63684.1 DUF2784 domain-containing protein [Luteimonas deserti]
MHLSPGLAAHLADAVLALHVAIAAFVVAMTLALAVGGPLGWRWVRRRALRRLHVALVLVIALQAWLGRLCPLTVWEQQLRAHAGQTTYDASFVAHWLSRVLFFELPWWVFVLAYTAVAAVVVAGWWRWPPLETPGHRAGLPPKPP